MRLQAAVFAAFQIPQTDIGFPDPVKLYDVVAHFRKHPADLTVSSFVDRDFEKAGISVEILSEQFHIGRCRHPSVDLYALPQPFDLFFLYDPVDRDFIGLVYLEFRMQQFLHQFSVVA